MAVIFLACLYPVSLIFPEAGFRVPTLNLSARIDKAYFNFSMGSDGITHCPGYHAFSVQQTLPGQLTLYLGLHGTPCSIYGQDIPLLKLEVTYGSSISSLSNFAWS